MRSGQVNSIVVMGVAGCGKSTVAGLLAARLGWEVLEGDSLHPAENIERMRSGIPLHDEDRAPWLAAVAARMREFRAAGRPLVVACSALARRYRDVLRADDVVFAHLTGPRDLLERRIALRAGHFMKAAMLDSQLATLEAPGPDERSISVDIAPGPALIVERLVADLRLLSASSAA